MLSGLAGYVVNGYGRYNHGTMILHNGLHVTKPLLYVTTISFFVLTILQAQQLS